MENSAKVILLIEDEQPLSEAIEAHLTKSGFQVVNTRTVKQAIDYIDELKKVDAIWLDHYLLGQESGLDFLAQLKNHEKGKNIPIFVISNTASEDKVQSYINFGITKYYVKSEYNLSSIIEDIKKTLS